MKSRFTLLTLAAALCLFISLTVQSSAAQTLYDNGPINGEFDAWGVNFGTTVSDSFAISGGTSTVNGMSFGAWLIPGDVMSSVEISITSAEDGGTSYFDQVVSITQSGCNPNNAGFNVCTETGMFNGPELNNGTYWVNLQNAEVTNGDPAFWDANSGIGCTSPGCPSSASTNEIGTIPSESFSILGTVQTGTGSTPEPTNLLLFGSGVLAAVGVIRRKLL
jgi:hypothetical protein